jgi:hypothetical protein
MAGGSADGSAKTAQHPNARRRSRTAAKGVPQGFLEQKLGVTQFDILGGLVKVLGQAAEHILQVGLPRYLGQSPGMVGFVSPFLVP